MLALARPSVASLLAHSYIYIYIANVASDIMREVESFGCYQQNGNVGRAWPTKVAPLLSH